MDNLSNHNFFHRYLHQQLWTFHLFEQDVLVNFPLNQYAKWRKNLIKDYLEL